jgi:hypothetical protein
MSLSTLRATQPPHILGRKGNEDQGVFLISREKQEMVEFLRTDELVQAFRHGDDLDARMGIVTRRFRI